jgi:FMN phosphatase YigB (HAD superfamily)
MQVFLRERNKVELFPGVLETLDKLRRRGLKLGAITNGNADMDQVT